MEETGKLLDHYQVLSNMICNRRCTRVAEIGVYQGKTTKYVLRSPASQVIRDYYAVDQWLCDREYWPSKSQEDWDALYADALKLTPWFHQLHIIKLDSVRAAGLFWDDFFDLVYIDADHQYDAVTADLKAWLPKVRRGGVLVGHDYMNRIRHNHQVKPAVTDFFGEGNFEVTGSAVWLYEVPV